jgi:hypothetical protein
VLIGLVRDAQRVKAGKKFAIGCGRLAVHGGCIMMAVQILAISWMDYAVSIIGS